MPTLIPARQPSFAAGMVDSRAPEEYQGNQLQRLYDGRLQLAGNGVVRRGGSKRTHPSALNSGATVYGLREFTTGSGTVQLCAFVGDTFYTSTDGGATWTQQATTLPTDYWSMVTTDACGTPTLYAANGGGSIYEWDGTTWSTLTGTSVPTGVKFLSVFGGRLYVAGHDGETVQASVVKDFSDWSIGNGALSVKVSTHDGDTTIRGLYQLGEALLVFKRKSTAYIAGFGQETLVVESGPEGGVSRSVGCVGFRTVQATSEDAVVWLSERGLEFYRLGGQIQLIGRPLQGFFDGLNHSELATSDRLPVGLYWPRKNEYWCAVPTGSSTENDRIVAFRPPGAATSAARWIFRPHQPVASLTTADRSGEGRMPYAGGFDGFVRELETGDTDDRDSDDSGGRQVMMNLRTRPFTFGDQGIYKKARVIRVSVQTDTPSVLTVAPVADEELGTSRTLSFDATSGIRTQKARVNARGYVLGADIQTPSDAVLQGVQLDAAPLRRGW